MFPISLLVLPAPPARARGAPGGSGPARHAPRRPSRRARVHGAGGGPPSRSVRHRPGRPCAGTASRARRRGGGPGGVSSARSPRMTTRVSGTRARISRHPSSPCRHRAWRPTTSAGLRSTDAATAPATVDTSPMTSSERWPAGASRARAAPARALGDQHREPPIRPDSLPKHGHWVGGYRVVLMDSC